MKLSAVDRGAPFALLGPGFGAGRPVLVEALREDAGAPLLAYAPFEAGEPRLFSGRARPVELVLDVAPRPLEPVLQQEGFREAVEAIRQAIAAGDVYQVCHTVRAHLAPVSGSELFAALCSRGLPRFAAWVRLPDGQELVSASPELFFETSGRQVHTEPMKGTARPQERAKLEGSEKDRAELAMITDLLRNDLTPVCQPRSVTVLDPRRLLELPYALQAVSDVVGELLPGRSPLDVLRALHPGGSVTGAPKRAALELIGKLETSPRGAYCGALGLLGEDRSVFGLLIRTATRTERGWVYGVGSGIVYDSDPDAELDEVRVKLGALR